MNTGGKLVLIDTGTAGQLAPTAPGIGASLAAAGVDPKAVDIILISHFHPDHINGIKSKEGQRVFPNAEINVPAPEWAFWMDDAKLNAAPEAARPAFLNVRRIFNDIAKDVKRFEPGGEVAPGITSIAAHGHTPGHTAFAVASGNQSMLVLGDTTNHPWLFARNPEWQAIIDTDGAMAAETRKKLLDRASADKMLVQGYHFPSRLRATSRGAAPATTWCRSCGSRRCNGAVVGRAKARRTRRFRSRMGVAKSGAESHIALAPLTLRSMRATERPRVRKRKIFSLVKQPTLR